MTTRASNDGPITTVDGTVTDISNFYAHDSTRPHVRTTRTGCIANGSFWMIRSDNSDAPRTGRWTSFSRVILGNRKIDHIETEEERTNRLQERAKHEIQKEGFGGLGVLMFAAAEINKYVRSETKYGKEDDEDQDDNSTTGNSDELIEIQGTLTRSKTKKGNLELDYYGRSRKRSKRNNCCDVLW